MLLDSGVAKYSRRELSNLTRRREVAKIELQNFASLRDSFFGCGFAA
ncbi:MAG: hypothetical protein ACI93T_002311 [Porticoccaceae bacterium]|jgi:hypothetical protein